VFFWRSVFFVLSNLAAWLGFEILWDFIVGVISISLMVENLFDLISYFCFRKLGSLLLRMERNILLFFVDVAAIVIRYFCLAAGNWGDF